MYLSQEAVVAAAVSSATGGASRHSAAVLRAEQGLRFEFRAMGALIELVDARLPLVIHCFEAHLLPRPACPFLERMGMMPCRALADQTCSHFR